jgi:hypothetical protein
VWAATYTADVGDTVEVYVIVRDCYGDPLGSRVCYFYSDRGGQDVFLESPDTTDINGYCDAKVTTLVGGESNIYVNCEGVVLGPSPEAIKWSGTPPYLRVGEWVEYEYWKDWFGNEEGYGDTTEVQLFAIDPGGLIDSVEFSYDSGAGWVPIATDYSATEPYFSPANTPADAGDGWTVYLNHTGLPDTTVDFRARVHFGESFFDVFADREYDSTPIGDVTFSIADWDTVKQETLYLEIYPNGVHIDTIVYYLKEKPDTFWKGIPNKLQPGPNDCAPTATAACFDYFGEPLTAGLTNPQLIDSLKIVMNTDPLRGTKGSDWVNGIREWIKNHGNGYTVRDREYNSVTPWSSRVHPPDWPFMRNELFCCENVLTGIMWPDHAGHAMVLNSIINWPQPGGRIRCDWMDPWIGGIVWGDLDPATGNVNNFTGGAAGVGGQGDIAKTIVISPKWGSPLTPPGIPPDDVVVVPGDGVNPVTVPIPMPWPPGACHWHFLYVGILDEVDHGCYHKFIIKWAPPAGIDDRRGELPKVFNLSQSTPNPFSERTEIRYAVPVDAGVKLEVYDVLGKKVRTLVSGTVEAGYHTTVWDGRDDSRRSVAPGIYYARMVTNRYTGTSKVIYLR